MTRWKPLIAALALSSLALAIPHGGEGEMDMGMSMNVTWISVEWSESFDVPNYFSHPECKFWIWSHIATMMIGWAVVLPIGTEPF
jgi:hypothetical protein